MRGRIDSYRLDFAHLMALPLSLPDAPGALAGEHERETLTLAIEADVRRFVARELHDQVVQTLTTTLLDMERFKVQQTGRMSVQTEVALLQDSVRGALNQIRTLLHDLRGQSAAEGQFVESVRDTLVAVFEKRTGIEVTLTVSPSWPRTLSTRAALNLHRTIQEALNNVASHAGATAVEIRLDVNADGECVVSIEDDGRGLGATPHGNGRSGLLGMSERAVLLGGRLTVDGESGRGTMVRLVVPTEGIA